APPAGTPDRAAPRAGRRRGPTAGLPRRARPGPRSGGDGRRVRRLAWAGDGPAAGRVVAAGECRRRAGAAAAAVAADGARRVARLLAEVGSDPGAPSRPEHQAEVWLGGLLEADPETAGEQDPDRISYTFRDGVRDVLLGELTVREAEEVVRRTGAYIERNLGR